MSGSGGPLVGHNRCDRTGTALEAYFDAANAGDAGRWASLYTEDAVMMPPNSPVVEGRAPIESWLAMLPVKITDAEGTALEVEGAGSVV